MVVVRMFDVVDDADPTNDDDGDDGVCLADPLWRDIPVRVGRPDGSSTTLWGWWWWW